MSTEESVVETNDFSLSTKVLIADSNKSKFKPLMEELEKLRFVIKHTNDRQTLVKTAIDFKPKIIIINLFLGNASSLAAIREIRGALQDSTKIIVLTQHYSKANIQECIKSGATDCVLDPFDTKLLIERIRYQLQEREAYSTEDLRAEPTQVLAGFQLIYECLKILAEIKDAHKAVHETLKRVGELADSKRINIILGELDTNKGIVFATSDDPNLEDLAIDLEKYNEVREVLINGSVVYIKDITSNPLTQHIKNEVKSIQISSLLVLPIRHRADTIGAMSIRLGENAMNITDKHLRTFYMVALCVASKVAAKKLLSKLKTH